MKKNNLFEGIDATLEIALFEYGLLVQQCAKGEYFCIYNYTTDVFHSGYKTEKEVNGYIQGKEFMKEKDIASFLSFVGQSKDEWIENSFASKLYDLLQYYGSANIMGSSWNDLTKEDVVKLIETESGQIIEIDY